MRAAATDGRGTTVGFVVYRPPMAPSVRHTTWPVFLVIVQGRL